MFEIGRMDKGNSRERMTMVAALARWPGRGTESSDKPDGVGPDWVLEKR